MDYLIDYKRIKESIKKNNAKNVLLQLPDGLKQDFKEICKNIESKDYELFLWMGSCFGACDIPVYVDKMGIDMIVHFGHEKFVKEDE